MINIAALGLYMFLTGVTGTTDAATAPIIDDSTVILVEAPKEESTNEIDVNVEAYVREYFKDTPILAEIARCESHFTQFTKSGKVLRGRVVPQDVGVMQINETYHLKESKKLGFDIYTLDGNLAYGQYLYEKLGARPWLASSPCWGKVAVNR
jgi:hypothetical protein